MLQHRLIIVQTSYLSPSMSIFSSHFSLSGHQQLKPIQRPPLPKIPQLSSKNPPFRNIASGGGNTVLRVFPPSLRTDSGPTSSRVGWMDGPDFREG